MKSNDESTKKDQTPQESAKLVDVVEEATESLSTEQVKIGEMLDKIQSRGFGPLLLLLSLIAVSPIGAIPGMSFITGIVIILIAVQMIFRMDHPWIPKRLEEIEVSRKRVEEAIERGRPWLAWIDRWIYERWTFLSTGAMHQVLAVLMILLSLTFFPLSVVPMGVAIPGMANSLLAIGITTRDGLVILFGFVVTVGSFASIFFLADVW